MDRPLQPSSERDRESRAELPSFLAPCFHDYDLSSLDAAADSHFVIERVLATGDRNAVRWLVRHYDENELRQVLRSRGSRRLDPRRLALWCLLLDVEEPVAPPWAEARAQLWPGDG